MTGTIINVLAVVAGSLIGMLIRSRLPERFVKIVFQAIGLFTLFLGVWMALKTQEFLILIGSLVLGAVVGELIDIDRYFNRFSEWMKRKTRIRSGRFSEGMVTAFLLYCMGSMTILGAIEEGINNDPHLLLVKSLMDGISSIALASALGIGVMFSAIPLLMYQGGLTLFASSIGTFFSEVIVNELTATGGILLIGLGINILEIKVIKILNMLPALVIVVILAYLFLG
ncbi:MAG: DUF554 domain-containing protein [Bacteroidetes bacterium]|nr:DUF554 domain-containing protein [Bacteroidota bacterium]